ncbi:MAG TPA: hypothetical protein VMH91_04000 [Candidatus Paceibacterota bacterium]|nr:hypothetical protein [Candidatus Paceibacterota bacterium]
MGGLEGIESPEERVLSESETFDFLRERGVAQLQDWEPGRTVLYVFPERFRKDKGAFAGSYGDEIPVNKRPTIARLDAPYAIGFKAPTESYGDTVYPLVNRGARIDYFVINAKNKKPVLVKTTIDKDDMYLVRREALFVSNDELFPPSNS